MYFVPGVGPVVYETTSIAGPVGWEVTYTRAGSTAAEAAQVGFTVSLDAPVYKAANPLDIQVRLTLRNTHTQPVTLVFPSGQRYDLRIWNDKGEASTPGRPTSCSFRPLVASKSRRAHVYVHCYRAQSPRRQVRRRRLVATQSREYVGIVGFEVTR